MHMSYAWPSCMPAVKHADSVLRVPFRCSLELWRHRDAAGQTGAAEAQQVRADLHLPDQQNAFRLRAEVPRSCS